MVAKKLDSAFGGSARSNTVEKPRFTFQHHTSPTAILAQQLIQDIATLYCSKPGEVETVPTTELLNKVKWDVYHVAIYQYDILNPRMDETGRVPYADPDMYDGLRKMVSDMMWVGTQGFECTEETNASVLHFKTIDDLVNTCKNLLLSEDCTGHPSSKQILLRSINTLINEAVKERAQDGFVHPDLGYFH